MKRIVTILFLLPVFFSCNKEYPDGGSHHDVKSRIIGNWTVHSFTVNGDDSMSILDTRITAPNACVVKDGGTHSTSTSAALTLAIANAYNYHIEFTNKKERMTFQSNSVINEWPFMIPPNDWEILKFTDNELEIQIISSKQYVLDLTK